MPVATKLPAWFDTTVCSVTTGVTVISPYLKDVYAPYIPRYLPIIYGDAEQYFVSGQIASLHCTDESKIMHGKERVSYMLPSYVCMQPITCRTRIEQTKESACNIDAPEISKVTCMHGKLVHYVATIQERVLTKYRFHQVRPPDQELYSLPYVKIKDLLSLKGTGWGPPADYTRSLTTNQTSHRYFCFLRLNQVGCYLLVGQVCFSFELEVCLACWSNHCRFGYILV